MENGSDVNVAKIDGSTPLMMACWYRHLDVATSLTKKNKVRTGLKTDWLNCFVFGSL